MQEVVPKKHGQISAIPKTGEQYISVTVGDMVFKDSYAFLPASLSDLVKKSKVNDLVQTQKFIEDDVVSPAFNVIDASVIIDENSRKRTRKTVHKSKKRSRNEFVDDEADASDRGDDDSEHDDSDCDSFIDDDELNENDTSFYNSIDNKNEKVVVDKKSSEPALFKLDDLPSDDYRKTVYNRNSLNDVQQQIADERFNLVTRKGVYPYEYFDNFTKFDESTLPPQTAFFNSLSGDSVSDDDFLHAHNVYKVFEMNNLWNYHDLYLLTDIFLLTDVLVSFRKMCLDYYKIDPFHSYTVPGFSWEAALRMTDVKLELLSDPNMHKLFELGIRGGISTITHRHAEADSEHSLLYIDANNLYGWSMSQSLPNGEF
jgi:hypothetical protein